jgi:hypothetical protein
VLRGQAVYVNLTAADQLTVAGLVIPSSGTPIRLSTGWNLIGFPSFLGTITAGSIPGATMVLDFAPAARPGQTRVMGAGEFLQAGRAYWVNVNFPGTWTVPGS